MEMNPKEREARNHLAQQYKIIYSAISLYSAYAVMTALENNIPIQSQDKSWLELNLEKTLLGVLDAEVSNDDFKNYQDFVAGTQEVISDTRFLLSEPLEEGTL